MIIKRIVTISLFITLSLMLVLLLVGVFVPTKMLEQFNASKSTSKTVVAVDKNGNQIVGAKVEVQADGSTVVVDASGNTVAGASATSAPVSTTPTTGGGTSTGGGTTTPPPTTGGGTTTPPPTTGGGTTTPAPTISNFSASPSSIGYNASTTLSWTSANATACSVDNSVGAVAATGSKTINGLKASVTYKITCTGAGGASAPKSASVTVAAAPVAACGAGGPCTLADITSHASAADCRSAIRSGTSGQPTTGAYQITASFITSHNGQKSGAILNKLCGKVYTSNLRNFTGSHQGSSLSGKTYDGWIANFYLGTYN